MARSLAAWVIAVNLVTLVSVQAADAPTATPNGDTAEMARIKGSTISKLVWKSLTAPVLEETTSMGKKTYVIFRGTLDQADWSLLQKANTVELSPEGDFETEVLLDTPQTRFELTAVGPLGEVESEKFEIKIIPTPEVPATQMPAQRLTFSTGIGPTLVTYKQTLIPDFQLIALTAKLAALYSLVPLRWDLGLNTSFTLLKLSSNSSQNVRFLGFNASVGYRIPKIDSPWQLSILGGFYYSTMLIPATGFGYQDIFGPQLFPTLKRELKNGDSISGYLKLSPVTDGISLLSLSNREFGIGAGWNKKLKNGRHLIFMMDLSNLNLELQSVVVTSNAIHASIGYNF